MECLPKQYLQCCQEKLEYMKPAEAAHYNFRNLPLEIFDHAPDFEVKSPQEWMDEAPENSPNHGHQQRNKM